MKRIRRMRFIGDGFYRANTAFCKLLLLLRKNTRGTRPRSLGRGGLCKGKCTTPHCFIDCCGNRSCSLGAPSVVRGSISTDENPPSGRWATRRSPSCISATSLTIESPGPTPPASMRREASIRLTGTMTRLGSAGGMPGPSSSTISRSVAASSSTRRLAP